MARNEEKHYGRLNRLLLQKQKEEYEKLHPKRPKLETLATADEIRHWIPSIKRDIDFYLKKSQVVCYSDEHVMEARQMVAKLEREFKAFLRKLCHLNSGISEVPWTQRAYRSKDGGMKAEPYIPGSKFIPIPTPVLDLEENQSVVEQESSEVVPIFIPYSPLMDLPLQFNEPASSSSLMDSFSSGQSECQVHDSGQLQVKLDVILGNYETEGCTNTVTDDKYHKLRTSDELSIVPPPVQKFQKNVLGIDYSSSSEDDV